MRERNGVAIAAPQVGFLQRLIVIDQGEHALALVNPVITSKSEEQEIDEEGCLSIPGVYLPVPRSTSCTVEAQGFGGELMSYELSGMGARIVQHEIDHLDGVLIFDRTSAGRAAKWLALSAYLRS